MELLLEIAFKVWRLTNDNDLSDIRIKYTEDEIDIVYMLMQIPITI